MKRIVRGSRLMLRICRSYSEFRVSVVFAVAKSGLDELMHAVIDVYEAPSQEQN